MEPKGFINQDYALIANAFSENFIKHEEIGASLCVYHNHKLVIDIWAGYKDLKQKEEWGEDTLVPVFSSTKAVAAACLAICHSKGLFEYDDKVCDYWKEFGSNGKNNITIEQLLQHRAGLSAIDHKLDIKTIKNTILLDDIIARQKPHWNPGDYQGYHVWNIGWYISALLKRLDTKGRRLKEFLKQEVLPNIEGEIRIGVDDDFEWDRIARLKPFSKLKGLFSMPSVFVLEFFKPWSLSFKSMLNPSFVSDHTNFVKREILQLEIGAGGGIANSKGLASLMDALGTKGHPLCLKEKTLKYLKQYPETPKKGFEDIVFKQDAFRFHAGFMKPSGKHNFSQSENAFGGFGAGGSFVFTDPGNNLTVAYTMNNMDSGMMNMKREVNIRNAVYKTITDKLDPA